MHKVLIAGSTAGVPYKWPYHTNDLHMSGEMRRLAHADVRSNGWVGELLCDRHKIRRNT